MRGLGKDGLIGVPGSDLPVGPPVTLTFTDADASAGFFGFFDRSDATRLKWYNPGTHQNGSTWTGYLRGSDATLRAGGGASQPFWVSVDDGEWTNPVITGGVLEVFSGLSDTAHLVSIRLDEGYSGGYGWTFRDADMFSITGTAPSITYGTLGTKWMLTDPAFPGIHLAAIGSVPAGLTPAFRDTLSAPNDASGCSIKIRAKCTEIWAFTGDTEARVSTDKGLMQTRALPNSAAYRSWKRVAVGLDGSAMHDYVIATGHEAGVFVGSTLGIAIGGPAAAFGTVPVTKRVIQYGDSITFGATYTGQCTDSVAMYSSMASIGALGVCCGVSGRTAEGLNTDLPTTRSMRSLEDVAIVAIGRNDTAGSAFRSSYTSVVNKLLADGVPLVLCRGIDFGNESSLSALDADVQSVVSAIADARVKFVPVTTWTGIQGVGPNKPPGDGTHPTVTGYAKMATYEVAAYSPLIPSG